MTYFKQNWHNWLMILGVFLLALIPRILHLGTFWGTDERYIWELANRFFLALTQGRFADTSVHGYPAITLMWIEAIAVWIRYVALWLTGHPVNLEALLGLDTPFIMLSEKQIVLALFNSLLVVVIFWLARKVFGLLAALIGVVFVALDPFLLAESRVIRTEGLVTGLMLLSFLASLVYLKEQFSVPAGGGLSNRKWLVLSAALTALAMLTKISATLLLPTVAMLGLATILSVKSTSQQVSASANGNSLTHASRFTLHASSLARWLSIYLLWAGLVAFCFWLFWPAMWVAPIETIQEVRTFAESAGEEGVGGRGVFFWGQVYPDDPGPWFYPVALLFRLTPLVLLGVVIAVVGLVLMFTQRWPIRAEAGWQWWGTLLLLAYALLFGVMMSLGAKKYDRYLLPIFPALDLVAGVGWLWAGAWMNERMGASSLLRFLASSPPRLLTIGWISLLALQSLTTLPHLPYYYTYYNPLLGGPRQAVNYIRVGFDEGLDQVAAYLESKPNAAQLKLASGVSGNFDGLFSGQRIALDNLDGEWVQGDYVMIYIAQVQRQKHSPDILVYLARHQPEYTLTLHGLEYAWLYPGPAAQYYGGAHKLEGRGTLFGYSFCLLPSPCRGGDQREGGGVSAGEMLPVTLYWRNEGQQAQDRFFVRLMDLDGYVWAEGLAQPRPGFEEANRQPNSLVESEAVLALPVGIPPGDYFFKPGFRTTSGEIIGYFELPDDTKPIQVTTTQAYPSPQTFESPRPIQLVANDDLVLVGYNLEPEKAVPGLALWVTLYWQALTDVTHDYVILLRLLDEQQQEVAYWLGRPVRSGYPTTEWRAGQIVQDPWLLTVPAEAPAGVYQLEIAIFDAASEAEVSRVRLGTLTVLPSTTE